MIRGGATSLGPENEKPEDGSKPQDQQTSGEPATPPLGSDTSRTEAQQSGHRFDQQAQESDGERAKPPADGERATPPADGESATPPADGERATSPADGERATPPADGERATPPADGERAIPPAEVGEKVKGLYRQQIGLHRQQMVKGLHRHRW